MSKLLDRISEHARKQPKAIAISDGTRAVTYAEFEIITRQIAAALYARGLREGDRIGLLKRSMLPVFTWSIAALRLGLGIVPLDERENPEKLKHIFKTADVRNVFAETTAGLGLFEDIGLSAQLTDDLEHTEAPLLRGERPDADNIWSIEPTSGSSGAPKLVPLSARVLDHYIETHAKLAELSPADKIALFGEMWFDTLFSNLWAGTHASFFDFRGRGSAELSEWMRAEKITGFQSYPVAFRALSEATPEPLPDLRLVRLAGEALLPRDVTEFEKLCTSGAVLSNYYGSTECGLLTNHTHLKGMPAPEGPLPAGKPPFENEVFIETDDGRVLPQGVSGVIVKRCEMLADGYLNNPEQSKGVYWTDEEGRRVLCTGDLGYFDEAGCLHLIGRTDDQVKIRGYSVRYSEVEAELSKDAGFAELAVTSWISSHGQRQLVCHYALEAEAEFDLQRYRSTLQARLPAYMIPNYFVAHKALPKTESGKIKRRALPEPDLTGAESLTVETLPEPERAIATVWQKVLGHAHFGLEDDFFDIGGDSLQAMSMMVQLEEALKVRLGYESLVMQGASISKIAKRAKKQSDERMILLKGGTGAPPVFVLPVENGEFSDWLYVLNASGRERPYYGVHVRDVSERRVFRALSVEELARYAADTIIKTNGVNPAVIAGFSAGTLLALETARQLAERGVSDVSLVLIEPTAPQLTEQRKSWWWRRSISPLVKHGALGRSLGRAGHILLGRPIKELPIADETAFRRYQPKPFAAPRALVFSCLEENPHRAENEAYWRSCLGPTAEIVTASGNHQHIVRDPNAEALAKSLEKWIAEKTS